MKNIYSTLLFALLLSFSAFAETKIYAPELRLPVNEAIGQMPNVLLDWNAVAGQGFVITYELQLAQSPDFSDAVSFPPTMVTAHQMSNLKFDEVYYWRVKASDGTSVSDWSSTFSFRVVKTVTITAPADQSTLNPAPTVKWSPITGVSNYELQIDTSAIWSIQSPGISPALNSIYYVDNDNAWAVGDNGTILRYANGAWSAFPSGTVRNLRGVWFTDHNNGWAVGANGTILHFDGTAWTAQTSGTTVQLNAVYFTSPTNGYAVGNSPTATTKGVSLKFNGTAWSAFDIGIVGDVYAIHGLNEEFIWAGGKAGRGAFFNGTSWANSTIASNRDILSLWVVSPTNVWASAPASRLFRFNGSSWAETNLGSPGRNINGICFIDENNGYAVGNNGVLYYYNGTAWEQMASGTTQILNGIHFASSTAGGFVGNSGFLMKYKGLNVDFASPYLKTFMVAGTVTELEINNLAFGKLHIFRIRAIHPESTSAWSSVTSFPILRSPTLTTPVDNATNIALDTLVKWTSHTGIVRYTVQLAMNPNFIDPFTYESFVPEYRFIGLIYGQDYYWRVMARHGGGASPWSPVFKFTTSNTVNLIAPANNATNLMRNPRFSWSEIRGTQKYLLQFCTENTFTCPNDRIVTNSFYQIMYLLNPDTDYYWRVRAIQGLDSTNWSQVRKFTTTAETSIGENDKKELKIYPNPGNGEFNLVFSQFNASTEIKVYNLIGKIVHEETLIPVFGSTTQRIDLRGLGKGVYLIRIYDGSEIVTRKLIIE
ncbi:MAG: T9SS type A sorting domain-containing protein [Bacteroidales bacterium]|nr:T9SS type A sorting domain-containing protein [Bacteroidales bacterium]